MTLGVEFHLKALELDGETVKLQIWDFAGEERFRFLFPTYIRGANGAVFMYDITNYGSLTHVDDWFEIVEKEIDYELPIVFVGGKTDLIHLKEVSTKKAMNLAISKGAEGFFECSSKTGENIDKIFNLLTHLILKNRES
jgi:small GTP-binding protein